MADEQIYMGARGWVPMSQLQNERRAREKPSLEPFPGHPQLWPSMLANLAESQVSQQLRGKHWDP